MDDDETLQKALLRSTFYVLLRQLDVLESAIIRNDADVENIKSQLNLVSQTLKYIQNITYSLPRYRRTVGGLLFEKVAPFAVA